jgi:hypothetical protein
MSVPVAIDDLVAETERYGFAYLVTVRDDETPHIVAGCPTWRDGYAVIDVGRGTARNAVGRPAVTLCYAPTVDDGYSLIVDGTAEVTEVDDVQRVAFVPDGAVLHRPAAPGFVERRHGTGCENDCLPVGDGS